LFRARASDRPARSRLAALDGLRLLAAFAVLSFHYTGIRTKFWDAPAHVVFPSLNEVSRYGYMGVELFFIISGFVILMTAYGRSIESFAASRVARLFPAYWAAIVLTFILQELWKGGRRPTFLDALVNLTMVQDAFNIPHVQGAFWTLWIELKFYLLIGVFILIGMTRRRMIAFAFLWPLIGQIAAATHTTFLMSLLSPSYAPYFAVGICLFLLHREGHDAATWLVLAFNWVLCVHQAAGYAPRASQLVGAHVDPVVTGLAASAMIVVVFALTHGPLSRIEWRWLTWGGALTYPLYLVHGQVGFFVIDKLHTEHQTYVVLAAATFTSFLVAWLIHQLVEKPTTRPLRRAVENALQPAHSEETLRHPEHGQPAPRT
jgi:peptidoglycan/LPS O-acetylase OafA/YrhL